MAITISMYTLPMSNFVKSALLNVAIMTGTVDTVNGLVLHYVNRGADFALFSMSFTMFLVKYIKLRKTHELIVAIIFGLLAIAMLVVWILQLLKVL